MPVARVANQRIPQGRYWSDVFEKNRVAFDAWLDACVKMKLATLEHTESFDDQGRTFVIFSVTAPLGAPWPSDEPLPPANIAGPEIRSAADTVTRPDPPKDVIESTLEAAGSAAKVGFFAVVVVGLVAAISALRRG